MKLIAFVVSLGFFLVPMSVIATDRVTVTETLTLRPAFVEEQIVKYSKYGGEGFGFSGYYAWGTAKNVNGTYYWFAFTNSDAYFQLVTSKSLTKEEMQKIEKLRDRQGRAYSAQSAWIGTSNDWLDDALKNESAISKSMVTKRYLKVLAPAIKEMRVREYL